MTIRSRKYISLYFKDAISNSRKKGYITVAFNSDSTLYKKIMKIGGAKIKSLLNISSYKDLLEKAKRQDRTVSNYIKHSLKEKTGSDE